MNVQTLRPIRLPRALLFFGLPLLIMTAMFWGVVPLMDLMGVRLFLSFAAAFGISMILLLLLTVRFYRKEGNPWNRNAFASRFRLRKLSGTDWVWTLGLIAFVASTFRILRFTFGLVAERIPEPKFFIRMLDPDPNYFMELPTQGNGLLFLGMLIVVVVIVIGQELWWRGYILPRQEAAHGKTTWLIHGVLWFAFLLFVPWIGVQLLPAAFAIPYVSQRLQNTWPAILAHFALWTPVLIELGSRI